MKRFLVLIGLLWIAMAGFCHDSTTICRRLSALERQIPLPYHSTLDNKIQPLISKPLPDAFGPCLTMLNDEIHRLDLPEELRYLPIALTGMQPGYNANERAGIWALPVLTAMYYGLSVDESHDERLSVEASTKAALTYLYDLHESLGDWWLCLLAYTNSPSAVRGVLTRHPDADLGPWDFVDNQWLPNTAIVGDFIGSYYVYANEQPESPMAQEWAFCEFDQPIAVSLLSTTTGVAESTLRQLNPVFLTDVFVPFKDYKLKLPKEAGQLFEANKEQLYKETTQLGNKKKEEPKKATEPKDQGKTDGKNYITYTVKPGDTLSGIASKYHVTVNDIKKWNNLKNDFIRDQQKLKIYQ